MPYVDIYAELAADAKYWAEISGNDGAHPENTGYERIAAIIKQSAGEWFT